MRKILSQDVFSNFIEMLLGFCLHPYDYVYLMFTWRCRQADIVATVLSPVSLLPAMNIASVVVTCPLVIAGVIVTGD